MLSFTSGAVAQLGERRVRNAEVRGSIPLSSTSLIPLKTLVETDVYLTLSVQRNLIARLYSIALATKRIR